MIKDLIRKHSVATYFALTFAISWGGVLAVVGWGGFPGTAEQFKTLLPIAVVAMIAGPSVASLALTGLVSGRAGLHEFRLRLLKWRVGFRWYAAALLIAPSLMMGLLFALSIYSRQFLPGIVTSHDRTAAVLSGLAIALGAGIFEELGWTGFATPALRRRHGILATGLMVGVPWAVWHLLVGFWASGAVPGRLNLLSYMLDPFLFLTSFRVLMVWVYDRTGSLLIGILVHLSLTGSARIIGAPGIAGFPLILFDLAWFTAVWIVIAAVTAANLGHFSGKPVRTRLA